MKIEVTRCLLSGREAIHYVRRIEVQIL